jgi:exosortase/archaeosortase family protein
VWNALIGWLQPPSQLLSGRIAAALLRGIGIPVLQDGTRLGLSNVTLEVLRECSGVNQLLAVLTMALAASHIWLRTLSRRATLIGLAVIGAYVSNGVRIALVGVLATRGLSDGDLRGVHLFEGLAISALCYLLILASLSLLSKNERRKNPGKPTAANSDAGAVAKPVRPRSWPEIGVSMAVLSIGVVLQFFNTPDVRLRGDLRAFPARIGDWSLEASPTPARFPAIDDDLVHAYPSPEGARHFDATDDELVRA